MALQSNNGNVSGKLKAYVGISNYQTFKDPTNCRKRKINCGKDSDDERIVEVQSDSALLRAKGADREKPGKV